MNNSSFVIEFNNNTEGTATQFEDKFVIQVNVISKSLQLFEVSNIRTIKDNKVSKTKERYILTAYTFERNEQGKWKDALTLKTNRFFELVGKAIEEKYFSTCLN